jgi:hypothetical protein
MLGADRRELGRPALDGMTGKRLGIIDDKEFDPWRSILHRDDDSSGSLASGFRLRIPKHWPMAAASAWRGQTNGTVRCRRGKAGP